MKAISPVIATVIIVAVAIAISIAVALWITGLTSSFTGVEKLEIINAYAEESGSNEYNVYIIIKNTGTKTATIDQVFVNNKPYSNVNATSEKGSAPSESELKSADIKLPQSVSPGKYIGLKVTLNKDEFTSGQTVSIVVHTASGGQYPATVTLP